MQYTTDLYTIRCLTNMHVGSGDTNYGIIDKQVQRDVITEMPIIHSSSMKGALRQHAEMLLSDKDVINDIFGSENNKNSDGKSQTGTHRFFTAQLLSLPVRSDTKPFFRAFSLATLRQLCNDMVIFNVQSASKTQIEEVCEVLNKKTDKIYLLSDTINSAILEDQKATAIDKQLLPKLAILTKLLGDNLALFPDDDFKELVKNLPVIARNHLENGISKNLWYEEIVPRESVFYTLIARPLDNQDFQCLLRIANHITQIGANASIGYGFCKFTKL
ncbi:MAG: type III-B CRISPR module RAMP protein Cmr4 [Chitinophagales bacterium]|nr:type III-B CRISPR module RAMP protein Cmr4 [Chitinophagales bacterium]